VHLAGPAHRPHFVVNGRLSGGTGRNALRALRERVAAAFPAAAWTPTAARGEGTALALAAARAGAGLVVAVGGDGTVNEVVNGLMASEGRRPVLGIVPAGRGSDFARTLGLPRDPVRALEILAGGDVRRIDVAAVDCRALDPCGHGAGTRRYFVNMAGCGASGRVVERMERWHGVGAAGYALAAALTAFDYRWPLVELSLDGGPPATMRLNLLFVCNGQYCGGGMCVGQGARPDDGELLVVEAVGVGRLRAMLQWPQLYFGGLQQVAGVRVRAAREVAVAGPASVLVDCDGELCGRLPATYRIVPGALDVRVPAS